MTLRTLQYLMVDLCAISDPSYTPTTSTTLVSDET